MVRDFSPLNGCVLPPRALPSPLPLQASLLGEAITGQGILNQINIETGIPISEAEPLLLFFIAFTVLGAIGGLGDRGQFVDEDPAPAKSGSLRSLLGLGDSGECCTEVVSLIL